MSRSYKKNNWIKDYSKKSKSRTNRKFRRLVKQKIKNINEDTILPKNLNEVNNLYNILYYKFLITDSKYGLKGKNNKLFK